MRMICLVNCDTLSVTVYSLCKRDLRGKTLIEEELVPMHDKSSFTHYDTNVSWRRFKKEIQKKGFTFPSLENGY